MKRFLIFVFGFFALSLLLTGVFWGSLKQTFIEWTLKDYCKKCLGYRIAYEKLIPCENNLIRLKGLTVVPVDPEKFSCGRIKCPDAWVEINFDFQKRTLMAQVTLENFDLSLDEPILNPLVLAESCGSGQKLFFDPSLKIQGRGHLAWKERRNFLSIDFDFGKEAAGMLQWDQTLIQFSLGAESQKIIVMGEEVDGFEAMSLLNQVFSLEWPWTVAGGTFSGIIAMDQNQTCGALRGRDLDIAFGSLRGTFPEMSWSANQDESVMTFSSGTLSKGKRQIHEFQGDLAVSDGGFHLLGRGRHKDILMTADLRFGTEGFEDNSMIQLDSDVFHGEILFSGNTGTAHFSGLCEMFGIPFDLPCFDIEAEIYPSWQGVKCLGKLAVFGKNVAKPHLDFQFHLDRELTLQEGNFQGHLLRLSCPLAAWNQEGRLEGWVDAVGDFDEKHMSLILKTDDLQVKSDEWRLALGPASCLHISSLFSGEGFFVSGNLDDGVFEHFSTGLVLTDLSASYQGGGETLYFEQVSGCCDELQFGGDVMVTLSPEVEVEVYQHIFSGKFSDIQQLLTKARCEHVLVHLPLEGNLEYPDGGAYFKWNAKTGSFQGTVGALVTEGVCREPFYGMICEKFKVNFVYDIGTDYLEVLEGSGQLILPKGESLPLMIDRLVFSDVSQGLVEFDFWGGDKKRDIFRICGSTGLVEEGLQVVFNKEGTHLGALYPDQLNVILTPGGQLEELYFETGFQINAVEKELRRFAPIIVQNGVLLPLDQMVTGDFFLRLALAENQWDCKLQGKEISIGGKPFHHFQLLGTLREDEWHLQELTLDDLSLAADLVRQEDGYRINFLGCEWSETSLFGIDGKVSPYFDKIEANLNLIDLNLQDLAVIAPLQKFITSIKPQGNLKATGGKLVMEFKEGDWDVDLRFRASLKNFSLDGIPFYDMNQIAVDYQTNKSLNIRGIESAVGDFEGVKLDLNHACIDLDRNEMEISNLSFQVPSSRLESVTALLQEKFPGAVNSTLGNILKELKTVEPLTGSLNFHLNPVKNVTELVFDDGFYQIFDHNLDLRHFKFVKNDEEICLSAECRFFDHWMGCGTHFVGKTFPHGILEVRGFEDELLQIWWKKEASEETQFFIEKIQGKVAGAEVFCERNEGTLEGTVQNRDFSMHVALFGDRVEASDVHMNFMKGSLHCPNAALIRNSDGKWEYQIEKVEGRSWRSDDLSLWNQLIDPGVVIETFRMTEIYGNLTNPTLLSGKGSLTFFNSNQPELRAFPFVKEKIQDISLIRPHSGTLEFKADRGEWIITGLYEVVDQRKLFRYSLPGTKRNSLDPNGPIHLIFNLMPNHQKVKIGDHVSIVVEGTLENPRFSLQRTEEALRQ